MKKHFKSIVLITLIMLMPKAWAVSDPIYCMAKNIYFEARGEPTKGKLAVAKVVLNRVKSSKFPNSICAVVYEPYQFSWTLKPRPQVKYDKQWQESIRLAKYAVTTNIPELAGFQALYFHNTHVHPHWQRKRVAKIGNHVFYN